MKTLVVYYSRSGITKGVAQKIAKSLKADLEEITEIKSRHGVIGFLRSGREAMGKKKPEIQKLSKSLKSYDLVVVGTPVWASNVSSPVRSFLHSEKDSLNKVAFFCTMGSSGDEKTFSEMELLCGKKPIAVCSWISKEALNEPTKKLVPFIAAINKGPALQKKPALKKK